jgi:hypothetical protein
MKKLKVKKSDVGKWVSVKWDCVGRIDCLLVYADVENGDGRVYEPHDVDGLQWISLDQIVEVRDRLNAS